METQKDVKGRLREFEHRLKELIHYRRNVKALPGNELCYKGEKDGHFQIPSDPYLDDLQEHSIHEEGVQAFRIKSGVVFEDPSVKAMQEQNRQLKD